MTKTKDIVEEIFTLIEIIELQSIKQNSEAKNDKEECSIALSN